MITTTLSPLPLNGVFSRMASLNRVMEDIGRAEESNGNYDWIPAMDAWETEHAFQVQLDLPGVASNQVDVSFDKNTLTVRGTRNETIPASNNGEQRVFFTERAAGGFSRTLRFPQYVDASKIEAKFENGVLTVTVPKSEAAKPRKIQIESN